MSGNSNPTSVYDFDTQYKFGKDGELFLDKYFNKWFDISPVDRVDEKRGIDRKYIHKSSGTKFTVEYKTDKTASKTGNVFIETISIDSQDKPGWVINSQAQLLVYLIPSKIVLIADMMKVKYKFMHEWINYYDLKIIKNDGYNTIGMPVPIEEFEKCCFNTIHLEIANGQ